MVKRKLKNAILYPCNVASVCFVLTSVALIAASAR